MIGLPVTLIIAIVFTPFVGRLPRRTACGIVIAGMVYVGAALGLEAVGGWWIGQHGRNNWTYSAEVVVEETLEMVGALMFVDVVTGVRGTRTERACAHWLGVAAAATAAPIPNRTLPNRGSLSHSVH